MARITLGALTALSLAVLLTFLLFATVDKLLYAAFISNGGPGFSVTAREQSLYTNLSALSHFVAVLIAFVVGGLVASDSARAYPGLRGAVSAALVVTGVLFCLAVVLVIWAQEPINDPGQEYTRSENLGNVFAVGFIVFMGSPFAILAGYLGGRFGRLLLRRTARR